MKNRPLKFSILVFILIVGCTSTKSSSLVTIPFENPVSISNREINLTIEDIEVIDSKLFGNQRFNLKDEFKDKFNIYEIKMTYKNNTDSSYWLSYEQLKINLPDIEDSSENLSIVGWCEPEYDYPQGDPTYCENIRSLTGGYILFHELPYNEPGTNAKFNLIIILDTEQTELEISLLNKD